MKKTVIQTKDIAKYIDSTLLAADATRIQIEQLCTEAIRYNFATVCINPCWVRRCAELLKDSTVGVCSVIGFPLGANTAEMKVEEARHLVALGASEVDMVMNIGMFISGEYEFVEDDIHSVVSSVKSAVVKVIIETCLLDREQKILACQIVKRAGAHFVKTSTGFNKAGAAGDDIVLMRSVVGPEMGVKAAGGIRTLEKALSMITAGANRIGTSSGVKIVSEVTASGDV